MRVGNILHHQRQTCLEQGGGERDTLTDHLSWPLLYFLFVIREAGRTSEIWLESISELSPNNWWIITWKDRHLFLVNSFFLTSVGTSEKGMADLWSSLVVCQMTCAPSVLKVIYHKSQQVVVIILSVSSGCKARILAEIVANTWPSARNLMQRTVKVHCDEPVGPRLGHWTRGKYDSSW